LEQTTPSDPSGVLMLAGDTTIVPTYTYAKKHPLICALIAKEMKSKSNPRLGFTLGLVKRIAALTSWKV
jgi:hypothetical protein